MGGRHAPPPSAGAAGRHLCRPHDRDRKDAPTAGRPGLSKNTPTTGALSSGRPRAPPAPPPFTGRAPREPCRSAGAPSSVLPSPLGAPKAPTAPPASPPARSAQPRASAAGPSPSRPPAHPPPPGGAERVGSWREPPLRAFLPRLALGGAHLSARTPRDPTQRRVPLARSPAAASPRPAASKLSRARPLGGPANGSPAARRGRGLRNERGRSGPSCGRGKCARRAGPAGCPAGRPGGSQVPLRRRRAPHTGRSPRRVGPGPRPAAGRWGWVRGWASPPVGLPAAR